MGEISKESVIEDLADENYRVVCLVFVTSISLLAFMTLYFGVAAWKKKRQERNEQDWKNQKHAYKATIARPAPGEATAKEVNSSIGIGIKEEDWLEEHMRENIGVTPIPTDGEWLPLDWKYLEN